MEPMKLFVKLFFGALMIILIGALCFIGGIIGAVPALFVAATTGSTLSGSVAGGALAALAWHLLCLGLNRLSNVGHPNGADTPKSKVTESNRHLWGSLSFFLSTVLTINLVYLLVPATFVGLAAIFFSGALGLLGIGLVLRLNLWDPTKKKGDL